MRGDGRTYEQIHARKQTNYTLRGKESMKAPLAEMNTKGTKFHSQGTSQGTFRNV